MPFECKNCRSAHEEETWLDLAAHWIKLAGTFEEDGAQRTNGPQPI
jgi:hypothetical protein